MTLGAQEYATNLATQSGVKELPPEARADLLHHVRRRVEAHGGTLTSIMSPCSPWRSGPPSRCTRASEMLSPKYRWDTRQNAPQPAGGMAGPRPNGTGGVSDPGRSRSRAPGGTEPSHLSRHFRMP
jgi:hypothetical protein